MRRRLAVGTLPVFALFGCGRIGYEWPAIGRDVGEERDAEAAPLGAATGSRDAGTPGSLGDAGFSEDEGGPAQPQLSCAQGALVCEGFETNLEGWLFRRTNGTATTTTQLSHTGTTALELTTQAAGAVAYLERSFPVVSQGVLHLRAFVWVAATVAVDGYDFVVVTNDAQDVGVAATLAQDGLSLKAVASGSTASTKLAYPRDAWMCVELEVATASPSEARAGVDGSTDPGVRVREPLSAGGYARVAIGIVGAASTQAPTRIIIDDVVVATEPIGCD